MGKELWLEVEQNMLEYNFDLMVQCSQCSICLIDFNARNKDENIAGDSVI
jgi:hypothetical protein